VIYFMDKFGRLVANPSPYSTRSSGSLMIDPRLAGGPLYASS
jgi:hypothetical protein